VSYRNHARYSSPVLAPPPGRPAEWEILLRLAAVAEGRGAGAHVQIVQTLDDEMVAEDLRRRTGAQAYTQADALLQAVAPWRGPERLLDLALRGGPYGLTLEKVKAAPHGIDLGPLAPRVPEVLRTPSGKIELAPALFLDDLKHAEADLAAPAPDLVVIGRRDLRSNNSWMHNLPVLAKGPRRCTALVHPADAARCGVTDASSARLIGASGHAITVEVKISDEVMPGVISLPHGWGHDLPGIHLEVAARRPGANLNALLDENLRDPLSGNAVLSGVPVRLEPEA
jgi:anaerobic selenocysteine-containing dehydrogenase